MNDLLPHPQVSAVQRALLAPLLWGDRSAWLRRAGAALRQAFGADHVAFVLPDPEWVGETLPLHVASPGPPLPVLGALCESVGRARAAPGVGDPGGGSASAPLTPDLAGWNGGRIGLSTPLPGGGRAGADLFYAVPLDAVRARDLEGPLLALAPTVECLVGALLQRRAEVRERVGALRLALDELAAPLVLAGAGGEILHWNRALIRLLNAEPSDVLSERLRAWARHLAAACPGRPPPPAKLTTDRGDYRITGAGLSPALLPSGGAIVSVSRVGLGLPTPAAIRDRFGTTAREAEVALLLAQGRTDREIASALIVAHATARRHTERTLHKLGVTRRSAVAARLVDDVCVAVPP